MRIPGSLSLSLLHWRREQEERSEGVGPGWVQPPWPSFPTTWDTIWVPCWMCTLHTAGWICTWWMPAEWQPRHRTDCVGPRHPPIIAHAVLQGTNIYFYFSGPYW